MKSGKFSHILNCDHPGLALLAGKILQEILAGLEFADMNEAKFLPTTA